MSTNIPRLDGDDTLDGNFNKNGLQQLESISDGKGGTINVGDPVVWGEKEVRIQSILQPLVANTQVAEQYTVCQLDNGEKVDPSDLVLFMDPYRHFRFKLDVIFSQVAASDNIARRRNNSHMKAVKWLGSVAGGLAIAAGAAVLYPPNKSAEPPIIPLPTASADAGPVRLVPDATTSAKPKRPPKKASPSSTPRPSSPPSPTVPPKANTTEVGK